MAVQKIVVDPVTRIEGHLRVEVEVENGVVKNAWSHGTMFRGFEQLLKGKDPRDASYVTERVCGVCTCSHGLTSALTLDQAFGAQVPEGGRLIRNLILGAIWLHDHPLHFYHLSALDYLDVMAVAQYQGNDKGLQGVKDKILKLVQMGDTSPLTPRYEPDQFCVRDPEIVLSAVSHYLKALEIQAKAKKMCAIFAGKIPHNSSMVVGGVTKYPNLQDLDNFRTLLKEVGDFVRDVYVPDVLAFGTGPLLPLAQAGVGGFGNFLAYGWFPNDKDGKDMMFKAGVVMDGQIGKTREFDSNKILEEVKYSWYEDTEALHPSKGVTRYLADKKEAYSWMKAPRYDGKPMEVGPLARMLVQQHKPVLDLVTKYKIKPGAVARHAARAVETLLLLEHVEKWLNELYELMGKGDLKIHDTEHWDPPKEASGMGLSEAPRGALGHWIEIKEQKIANYQLVVPSTWNLSPRDGKDQRGPVEEALIGAPVPDPKNPINVVRIIRSFDPCISCAVHLIEPETNEILEFRIG